MSFKIRTNIMKGFNKVIKLPYDEALEVGAMEIKNQISDNADKGKGYKGAFNKYSSNYKKSKIKSGRSAIPNLQYSGEMMRSIMNAEEKAKKSSSGWLISIIPPNRTHSTAGISIDKLAEYVDESRPFFGSNARYERMAEKAVVKFLARKYAHLQLS